MGAARYLRRCQSTQFGWSDADLRARVRDGSLTRVARGVYSSGDDADLEQAEARHRELVRAVMADLSPESVASHLSAAAVHGLPCLDGDLSRVHVTRGVGARRGVRTVRHLGRLEPSEIAEVDGISVTTIDRTVIDVACTERRFDIALAVAEAALHDGRLSPDAFQLGLQRRRGAMGIDRARRVALIASERSESPGESRMKALFVEAGLPLPRQQAEIANRQGEFIARVDFLWEAERLVGEFDGAVKYDGRFGDGRQALLTEKTREDMLRAQDYDVVRWQWSDLESPERVAADVRRRLARGARRWG